MDYVADLAQERYNDIVRHPIRVLDFIFETQCVILLGYRLMECFAIGPVAVNAVAIAQGVLHALVRTVEIHDVKRIVDEDFADQGLDDIAHWRVETALVIFCESVVLSDHRPPVGKLLGPIHKSRVLRRDFHEGMVQRYVGHIFEIGFATQI